MQDISDLIYTKLSLSFKPKVYDYKNRNLSEIKIQRFEDIKKLGLWMYGNSSFFFNKKKIVELNEEQKIIEQRIEELKAKISNVEKEIEEVTEVIRVAKECIL